MCWFIKFMFFQWQILVKLGCLLSAVENKQDKADDGKPVSDRKICQIKDHHVYTGRDVICLDLAHLPSRSCLRLLLLQNHCGCGGLPVRKATDIMAAQCYLTGARAATRPSPRDAFNSKHCKVNHNQKSQRILLKHVMSVRTQRRWRYVSGDFMNIPPKLLKLLIGCFMRPLIGLLCEAPDWWLHGYVSMLPSIDWIFRLVVFLCDRLCHQAFYFFDNNFLFRWRAHKYVSSNRLAK